MAKEGKKRGRVQKYYFLARPGKHTTGSILKDSTQTPTSNMWETYEGATFKGVSIVYKRQGRSHLTVVLQKYTIIEWLVV